MSNTMFCQVVHSSLSRLQTLNGMKALPNASPADQEQIREKVRRAIKLLEEALNHSHAGRQTEAQAKRTEAMQLGV